MSYYEREDNIGHTIVTRHDGQVEAYKKTYHYIDKVSGALVIRNEKHGNVATYSPGGWINCSTK